MGQGLVARGQRVGGGQGSGGGFLQGSTLGTLLRTLILPHARLCRVRRNSLSSMPEASLMSVRLRLSTSLNSISTTACILAEKLTKTLSCPGAQPKARAP